MSQEKEIIETDRVNNNGFMEIVMKNNNGCGVHTHRVRSIAVYENGDNKLIAKTVNGSNIIFTSDEIITINHVFDW